MNALENTDQMKYLKPIGRLVNPKNIIFCFRITGNRICMYLANKALADKIMISPFIIIGNERVQIRRLITPSKRLVISNLCPTIPHENIIQALENAGLKPTSSVIFLRSGIQDPEFAHLLSFRRKIFISENNEIENPESLSITYEETNYRIFMSTETFMCHICKQQGHIARNCQSTQTTTPNSQSTEQIPQTSSDAYQIKFSTHNEKSAMNAEMTIRTANKRYIESEDEYTTQPETNPLPEK